VGGLNPKQDNADPSSAPAWSKLRLHAEESRGITLADLLADPDRFERFSASLHDLFFDFSRYRATDITLTLLLELAEQRGLAGHIEQLFAGATVNRSEGRAALHTSLRGAAQGEVAELVAAERQRFLTYADAVASGERCGFGGKRFETVINIGIGGSDLGPRMLVAALDDDAAADAPRVEFVAGIDGIELRDALVDADPATTLFIVCSKTFTTLETRSNADAARAWLLESLPANAVATNFAAVSANNEAVEAFGLSLDNCFCIWDWVGGRYSLWSAVGLAAAIRLGSSNFLALLDGGAAMDEHFRDTPLKDNIPVTLALLGVWNRNFLKLEHQVVLPYDQRLEKLPAYLQQLVMESQGKLVRQNGAQVSYPTGAALWGGAGSNAQHSYAQWLHQGTAQAHVDFVATVNGPEVLSESAHLQSLANLAAQSDALAYGQDGAEVRRGLERDGVPQARIDLLVPQKVQPGNRSSLIVLLRQLNAFNLGMLLALYEHQVYVQSVIWGINPFDQWGVELGKQRAKQFAAYLLEEQGVPDTGVPAVVKQILSWRAS
jgi:glucose-6-phosphate isomerase